MFCELGFLIDMLEKAVGQNCQATNFLKTFGSLSAGPYSSTQLLLIADPYSVVFKSFGRKFYNFVIDHDDSIRKSTSFG
jgi:hypothetical protein